MTGGDSGFIGHCRDVALLIALNFLVSSFKELLSYRTLYYLFLVTGFHRYTESTRISTNEYVIVLD